MFVSPNGVAGTSYHGYNNHGSGLDLHTHHHYETATDCKQSFMDRELDLPYNGEHSQVQASQTHSHAHHSQGTHTDPFGKNTLPELSPMSYSLTATNYPFHPDTIDRSFYLDTMPASNLSLRQPTPFALSLQNEESKSAQGSRISISGSKTSIHGSRPSVYGSRTSGLHGSRPLVYNSGTSRESLLGLRLGKEHSVEEEEAERLRTMSLSHRVSSPSLPPNSSTDNIEVPTRDSPLPRPLISATSMPLGHGRKDFASLTCIPDYGRGGSISPTSPSPRESAEHSEQEGLSPMHKKSGGKRDLITLTSLDLEGEVRRGGRGREGTIPEEEESSESSKVVSEKGKERSPAVKKTRSKTMSRLEKLTSLEYIRQSFRMKKKKVSFEQSPEPSPKPRSKSSSKKGSRKARISHDLVLTNEMTQKQKDSGPAGSERDRGKLDWRQGRRNSSTSTDMFSPTENIARNMFLQQQQHPHSFTDHAMALGYAAQLSQPNYYLPPHVGVTGTGVPLPPPYMYQHPQLSQQYYPQLSQSYQFQPPYHVPIGDPFGRGLGPGGGGGGGVNMRGDPRYHEVLTPDYSDITTPEHERFTAGTGRGRKTSSEEDYDPRSSYRRQVDSPDQFMDTSMISDPPTNHSSDTDTEVGTYREENRMLGVHPEYNGFVSNGYGRDSNGYARDELELVGSPQRFGIGYMGDSRRGNVDFLHGEAGGEGDRALERYSYHDPQMDHIPEDVYRNSISVDDPPQHYAASHEHKDTIQNQTNTRTEYGHPMYSETSENKFTGREEEGVPMAANKGRVSWNSMVTTYPPEQNHSHDLECELTEL